MQTKLYLAPMRGFTDSIYRNTFARHFDGIDLAVAPFVSTVRCDRIKPSHIKDLLPEKNSGPPVIPQIMSNDPDGFIRMARMLFDLGYDTVNWNLGCPYRMVANKRRGSGLLSHPEMIDAFLEKTVAAIPNRVSVKTRLGRSHSHEIFKLMPIFNAYPMAEIIIHPRTGKQMYDGETDLEAFDACFGLSAHPVVYNGDINGIEAFRRLSERFPRVNDWMLGRGVLANPFLAGIIKRGRDDVPDKIIRIKNFHDDLFEAYGQVLYGSYHLLGKMNGLWVYLARSFKDSRKILKRIHKTRSIDHYRDLVARFFDSEAEWNF